MTQPSIAEKTTEIARAHLWREGPLLPILHDVQTAFGYVPDEAVPAIADVLNLGKAEVYGVVSFYHDFRRQKAGNTVLKLCRAEACQAMDGDATAARVKDLLGLDWGETSTDGSITLEAVYCLGLCACAPAALIDDQVRGRVDADALVAEVRS